MQADYEAGTFSVIDRASTLPADFDGNSQCADLHVSRDGRFAYVSNRGHNSIAVFSVSPSGDLELLQTESTQGEWPRNFMITPDGNWLLVANQYSNNIAVFRVNPQTGQLSYTGEEVEVFSPTCLAI